MTRVNSWFHDMYRADSDDEGGSPRKRIVTRRVTTKILVKTLLLNFGRGFGAGYLAYVAYKMLPALLKSRGMSKILARLRQAMQGVNSVRFGLFLGSYLAIYKTVMRATKRINPNPPDRTSYRSAVAGALAGTTLALAPDDSRTSISLFFFVRAIEIAARYGAEHGWVPKTDKGDTIAMMLASSQILTAWVFRPWCMSSSYRHFLDIHGGKDKRQVDTLRRYYDGSPIDLGVVNAMREKLGCAPLASLSELTPSNIIHPDHSVVPAFAHFFLQAVRRSIPVYVPVYVMPMLMFNSNKLVAAPEKVLTKVLIGIARSSTFLAMYCAAAWVAVDIQYLVGLDTRHVVAKVAGLAAGFMVEIEKKGRRVELAQYVGTQALETWYTCWHKLGYLPRIPGGDVMLFVVASSVIMQAHITKPDIMRPTYQSLLEKGVGVAVR